MRQSYDAATVTPICHRIKKRTAHRHHFSALLRWMRAVLHTVVTAAAAPYVSHWGARALAYWHARSRARSSSAGTLDETIFTISLQHGHFLLIAHVPPTRPAPHRAAISPRFQSPAPNLGPRLLRRDLRTFSPGSLPFGGSCIDP
jgi:hypothetical protein